MKSRVVPFPSFLAPEVLPYASVEIIRAEPVTTKLHLTAREMTACSQLLAHGRTLLEALESIQLQRALLASLASHAAPASVCSWHTPAAKLEALQRLNPTLSHGICDRCMATFEAGGR